MTTREVLKQKLDIFTDEQLCQIADFIEFLEFRVQKAEALNSLDDTPKEQVLADFKQARHEAMTGQGMPIAQLWEELKHD